MEASLLHSSLDQSISPYKHIRNPTKNKNGSLMISRPFEKFPPSKLTPATIHDGVLHAPPPSLSFSYPPSISLQPPLLPLPISKPYSNNSRGRVASYPPINRKMNNRGRDQSLTPKKSKKIANTTRGDVKSTVSSSECLLIESTNRLGPDPKDLPKDISRVLSSSSPVGNNFDLEEFSGGSVFTLSPPPSSLPLPTFSLRPRQSCNTEPAGIDAGATDNLRRLLRIR